MVQLPNLDVKYWGQSSLSKIGNIIAIPIKTDKYSRDRIMLKSVRILIEVNLEGPFPDFIEFINENGVLTRQQVKFEWLPTKCNHCRMYGREETFCRKKERVRKEWRPIPWEETVTLATTSFPLYLNPGTLRLSLLQLQEGQLQPTPQLLVQIEALSPKINTICNLWTLCYYKSKVLFH